MCGILGIYPPIKKDIFEKALHLIAHRGPDDFGIFKNDRVILGHRRLSIIDLSSDAHQPMSYGKIENNEYRYQIVFNGEIYNYIELRNELIAKGYIFHTQSDTEVVIASYDYWKEECLNRFNGMWAFAIWDNKKHQLFLSRDRFGKKPLFYAFVKNTKKQNFFVFASEMKAIYPFLNCITPHPNFKEMATLDGIFNYEQTTECLVNGIMRFPHSHFAYLDLKNNTLKLKRYYCILDHIYDPPKTYSETIDRFKELFLDATKIRMRSDVPLGTALSGGLDSSATICAMSHISKTQETMRDWQHAFVACFPNTPLDESEYAQSVVEHLNIPATYLNINPIKYWSQIEKFFYLFEELYITSPIPMIALYQSVKKEGVSVTLDGHGADELFSGYWHITKAFLDCGFNIQRIINIIKTSKQVEPQKYTFHLIKEYLFAQIKKKIGTHSNSIDQEHPNFKKMDHFTQALYEIFYETILPTLLRNYDRYSMINSVEIRMPFMDYRLVEFIFSLPYFYKIGNGYTKILIRDSLQHLMPSKVVWRKNKIGFNSPTIQWMKKGISEGGLREWFLDICHSKDFLQCPLIENPQNIQKKIINICHQKTSSISGEEIWTDINPYLWQKSLNLYGVNFAGSF